MAFNVVVFLRKSRDLSVICVLIYLDLKDIQF